MTIRITKLRLGALLAALALIIPSTAWATHVFTDVNDGAFYAASAEWAKTNGITTGSPAGSSTFKPLEGVTRGESVTFLKRYHDNLVQPEIDANTASSAANTAAVAANTASIPTVLWAKVNADGSKAVGSTSVTSSRGSTGFYTVDFGVDITACSWSGVIRNNASGLIFIGNVLDKFVILTQGSSGSIFPLPGNFATQPTEIDVSVRDNLTTSGAAIDGSFNIQVICT